MLGGEHDRANAILTINPGAGGTDSQDWAEMLLRMYLRWAERRGFKRDITDISREEAGIKSVTVLVQGEYAYGYLSAEAGVHRLVRISPFDGGRRQTSFASVHRVARARRGHRDRDRGQGSARRHLPVERCRRPARERHRLRGAHHPPAHGHRGLVPERAIAASQPRVGHEGPEGPPLRPEDEGEPGEARAVSGIKKDIAFGSQIRSYVLHPYRMVKDHRTKEQVGDVDRVLDGDIDVFIKSYLMKKSSGTLGAEPVDDDVD